MRRRDTFAFETTLSGRGWARRFPCWREREYCIKLFFLRLPTPEAAIARVAQRVSEGGHDVPEPVIRRRFEAGRRNFEQVYRGLVDEWAVYDNSGAVPTVLGEKGAAMSTSHRASTEPPRDPDLVGAEAAMRRAARRARERPARTGRPCGPGPGRDPRTPGFFRPKAAKVSRDCSS